MRPDAGRLISYVAPREHIFALIDSTDDHAADSDGEDRKHDQYKHCEIEACSTTIHLRVSEWRGDLDLWSVKSSSDSEAQSGLLIHHTCAGAELS